MTKIRKTIIGLCLLICTVFITSNIVFAEDGTHLSAKFNTSETKVGETITLTIGNSYMEVATFIGSISYDTNMLEVVDKSEAVLEKDDGNKMSISAEINKSEGTIGLISIGTSAKKYKAQDQLVKITFKAKNVGQANVYLSESTDGPSGCNADGVLGASINIAEGTPIDESETIEEIEQQEKTVKEIKIITPPTQTDYKEGESFNPLGMVVEVVYEDGTSEIITDYQIDQILVDENTNQITISYGDKTVTQKIKVKPQNNNAVLILIIVLVAIVIVIGIVVLLVKYKKNNRAAKALINLKEKVFKK